MSDGAWDRAIKMFEKLEARRRTDALRKARELGLVP